MRISRIRPIVSPYSASKVDPITFPKKKFEPKNPIFHFSVHLKFKSWIQFLSIFWDSESSKNPFICSFSL